MMTAGSACAPSLNNDLNTPAPPRRLMPLPLHCLPLAGVFCSNSRQCAFLERVDLPTKDHGSQQDRGEVRVRVRGMVRVMVS